MVKFAIYIKLKELNLNPVIIAVTRHKDIYFIKKYLDFIEIKKTFKELKEKDFDFLMVNSDQTWIDYTPPYLLDYGFLRFAENWKIPKFVYGTSYPKKYWKYPKKITKIARRLARKFNGVSVREFPTIKLAKKYLNVQSELVLDPTLLIDKQYYLNLIKDYKGNFDPRTDYLCVYQLDKNNRINKFIKYASLKLKLKVYNINIKKRNYIEEFLKCIYISKGVITDSYHGTIFSYIFEKPFVSFINPKRGITRFETIRSILQINDRILSSKLISNDKIYLLNENITYNKTTINKMKVKSLTFLKKNLLLSK